MKILFVVHDYWPKFNAGVENHVHYLAEALSKKNEVFIFTTEPYSQDEEHEIYFEKKVKVIKIHTKENKPVNIQETYLNNRLDKIFASYLDEIKPDVVHIQHLIRLSLSFINTVKERNIPIVYTLHDMWFECPYFRKYKNKKNCVITKKNLSDCNHCLEIMVPPPKYVETIKPIGLKAKLRKYPLVFNALKAVRNTPVLKDIFWVLIKNISQIRSGQFLKRPTKSHIEERNDLFRKYFEKVDVFISPSKFLAKEAIKFGIEKNKILVIPHGIPVADKNLKNIIKTYTKSSKINFGFTSHITEDKGFFRLLNDFERLSKKYKNIQLSIYGSYDKNDRVIKKALAGLNPPMHYQGIYDSKDTGKILNEIDVLVAPSLWNEIYGLVVDEALLYKTPVIISNRGGMPERVEDGKSGFIFNPEEKNSLYNKLGKIAEDPTVLNDLQKNLPKVKSIGKYSLEVEKIYKKLLDIK